MKFQISKLGSYSCNTFSQKNVINHNVIAYLKHNVDASSQWRGREARLIAKGHLRALIVKRVFLQ